MVVASTRPILGEENLRAGQHRVHVEPTLPDIPAGLAATTVWLDLK